MLKPILLATTLAAQAALPSHAHAEDVMTDPSLSTAQPASGLIEANGLSYHYEVHGRGEPILLLHGGLQSGDVFDPVLPILTDGRQVVAVDLQGHGRTAIGDRLMEAGDMADDMAAVLRALGHEQVDVLAYSLGGRVGLRLAIQHPGMVRRLALVGVPVSQDGYFPEVRAGQEAVNASLAEMMREAPDYQAYVAAAPRPEDFPLLLDRLGTWLREPYDWSEEARALPMPVMLVYGDGDMIRPEHMVEFFQLLGGGLRDGGFMREGMSPNRLAVLPGLTHYEIVTAPAMAGTVMAYFDDGHGSAEEAGQDR